MGIFDRLCGKKKNVEDLVSGFMNSDQAPSESIDALVGDCLYTAVDDKD